MCKAKEHCPVKLEDCQARDLTLKAPGASSNWLVNLTGGVDHSPARSLVAEEETLPR